MKRLLAAVLFLSAANGSFAADACPQLSPANTYVMFEPRWSSRGCTAAEPVCRFGEPLTFTVGAFGASLDCEPVAIDWDFGDGATGGGRTVTHQFLHAGDFHVTARLTTAARSAAISADVHVAADPRRRVSAGPSVAPPVDETTLATALLSINGIELSPGDMHVVQLFVPGCCELGLRPLRADVRYTIDATPYAAIDAATGLLLIRPDAPGGVTFRLYADVEHGRRVISTPVFVETFESNPLRGTWSEVAEIACDGGADMPVAAERAIGPIHMRSTSFDVSWHPHSFGYDYSGSYTRDTATKRVTFGPPVGAVHPDFRGDGTYEATKNADGTTTLRLKNVWFGRQYGDLRAPACGIVLRGRF